MNKLQGEFRVVCGELDEARHKNAEFEMHLKRLASDSDHKLKILTQECERLNGVI